MPDQPPQKSPREENPWRLVGRYSHMGLILPASVVAGLAIGTALDHWLKTSWITRAGLLVGCVAGFVELIRSVLKASKES